MKPGERGFRAPTERKVMATLVSGALWMVGCGSSSERPAPSGAAPDHGRGGQGAAGAAQGGSTSGSSSGSMGGRGAGRAGGGGRGTVTAGSGGSAAGLGGSPSSGAGAAGAGGIGGAAGQAEAGGRGSAGDAGRTGGAGVDAGGGAPGGHGGSAGAAGVGPAPGFPCDGTKHCNAGERCSSCNTGEGIFGLCTPDPVRDPDGYQAATATCPGGITDTYTDCDGPEDCPSGKYCVVGAMPYLLGGLCITEAEFPPTAPGSCCYSCDALPVCTLCWTDTDCPPTMLCLTTGVPNGLRGCRVPD